MPSNNCFPQHLECDNGIPADNAYDEMICAGCMKQHNFLWKYASKYAGQTLELLET